MPTPKPTSVSIRRDGRNNRGLRVLAARCSCGWVHMTAYRRFKKRRAHNYLLNLANRHVFGPAHRAASTPDGAS